MAKKKRGSVNLNQRHNGDPFVDEIESSEEENRGSRTKDSGYENPGLVLSSITLIDSNNYLSWKNSLIRALTAKDKERYVLDDIEDLEQGSAAYRKWKKCDCLVTSWILNTISKDLAEGFEYVSSSRELWDALEYRFYDSNGPMLFKIKRDISMLEKGDMSILQYFTKLKRMWDELLLLRPILSYKCGASEA